MLWKQCVVMVGVEVVIINVIINLCIVVVDVKVVIINVIVNLRVIIRSRD